ncbi:MAG: 50S ribosomal protein L10 [Candidatus Thermoplasmatota archaeon]
MSDDVAKWKTEEVKQLTDLLTNSEVAGVVNIGGIPAPQMQKMRKNLHGKAIIRSSRNTLIERALDQAEKKSEKISQLKESMEGQTAIIATDMNPFKLFRQIEESRTMAPAKGGETAAEDIKVKEGDTPFKPGPIVGDLQKVGIPAAIQKGKVVIKKDKVVVSEGEKISPEVAQMLTRLEIHPIEIGMDFKAAYEDGNIFKRDILDVDVDQFIGQIEQASGDAFKLAMETGWATKETVKPLLTKAHHDAFVLALEENLVTRDTVEHLLSKAYSQMQSLKNISEKSQKENN